MACDDEDVTLVTMDATTQCLQAVVSYSIANGLHAETLPFDESLLFKTTVRFRSINLKLFYVLIKNKANHVPLTQVTSSTQSEESLRRH